MYESTTFRAMELIKFIAATLIIYFFYADFKRELRNLATTISEEAQKYRSEMQSNRELMRTILGKREEIEINEE